MFGWCFTCWLLGLIVCGFVFDYLICVVLVVYSGYLRLVLLLFVLVICVLVWLGGCCLCICVMCFLLRLRCCVLWGIDWMFCCVYLFNSVGVCAFFCVYYVLKVWFVLFVACGWIEFLVWFTLYGWFMDLILVLSWLLIVSLTICGLGLIALLAYADGFCSRLLFVLFGLFAGFDCYV